LGIKVAGRTIRVKMRTKLEAQQKTGARREAKQANIECKLLECKP